MVSGMKLKFPGLHNSCFAKSPSKHLKLAVEQRRLACQGRVSSRHRVCLKALSASVAEESKLVSLISALLGIYASNPNRKFVGKLQSDIEQNSSNASHQLLNVRPRFLKFMICCRVGCIRLWTEFLCSQRHCHTFNGSVTRSLW